MGKSSFKKEMPSGATEIKKADVAKHPEAFQHVGLLDNKPSGAASLLFT